MAYWAQALDQAWQMLIDGDPALMQILEVTAKVATIPTVIAGAIGLPIGVALGIGRFRGRNVGLALANAGLGLPPVIIGLVFLLVALPAANGPLAPLHVLFTLDGVYIVQTVLALPVLIALTASSIRSLPPGLFEQARALHANRFQLAVLALREARIGVIAAFIAAVGSALSEVGAVILAGANLVGVDQTLASAALFEVDAGHFATALAYGYILLALILVVAALLTVLQRGGGGVSRFRSSS